MKEDGPLKESEFTPSDNCLETIDDSFWENLVKSVPAMVCHIGEEKECLYCNEAWREFRGQSLEAEHGNGWKEGIHPDDADSFLQCFSQEKLQRQPLDVQHRMLCFDGSYRWVGTRISLYKNERGEFSGYVTASYDITVQKSILGQLKKETRLMDKSPNIIFICDHKGKVEYVNKNGSRFLGCRPEQIIGQPMHNFDWGLKSSDALDGCIDAVSKGNDWHGELSGTSSDGKTFFVSGVISPLIDSKERTTHFVGILNDVTSLKQAQLSERRNRLLTDGISSATLQFLDSNDIQEMTQVLINRCVEVFQASTGFLFSHDTDDEIRLMSLAGDSSVPLTSEVTFSLNSQVPGDNEGTTDLFFSPIIEKKTILSVSNDKTSQSVLKISGAKLSCRSFIGVPLIVGETLVGMIALINKPGGFESRDKKDLESFSQTAALAIQNAQSEIARKKALDELRVVQKFEAIGKLTGGIAHDFNNLLTVINGYSELLMQKTDDEAHQKALGFINEAGEKASDLTRQLLAFSRQQVLDPTVLNLNDLIRNLQKIMTRLIREDIKIKHSLGEAVNLVKADPSQIEQILINLIVNARDAMPNGGQIVIETANVEIDDRFVLSNPGSKRGQYVIMTVRDTGRGMSKEVRMRVFEPFFTTKEPESGTGLGLSTVYGIVKQSHGYIKVLSTPGKGTTFQIYLPFTSDSATEVASDSDTEPEKGKETILLVEDEDSVLTLVSRTLSSYGYTVL